MMEVTDHELRGVKVLVPRAFADERGFFLETYNVDSFASAGITCQFVQTNHSRSIQSTLRGLHYQSKPGQAKLVSVIRGRVFDVFVDIRRGSPTFGNWGGVYLDDELHQQVYVPVGFAHGFCVVSEFADVVYQVSQVYNPATECSIRFDDPEIGVEWPVAVPIVSARDSSAESFASYRERIAGLSKA